MGRCEQAGLIPILTLGFMPTIVGTQMICIQMIWSPMDTPELQDLAREIRVTMAILTKMSHQSIEQRLNEHDIGVNGLQFGILQMLHFQPYTISELSRKFMLDPSTLVPVIDALEKKGFVRRGKDPNDRRRVPVSLTEQGIHLVGRCPRDENGMLVRALEQLGDEKARLLLGLLRELMRQVPDGENILSEVAERLAQAREFEKRRAEIGHDTSSAATS